MSENKNGQNEERAEDYVEIDDGVTSTGPLPSAEVDLATASLIPVARMSRDVAASGALLNADGARFLVDTYYQLQRARIGAEHQLRQLRAEGSPTQAQEWLVAQFKVMEQQAKRPLASYTAIDPVGAWSRSICGIGEVLAAGLLAHINVKMLVEERNIHNVGAIWRFAGLDPTVQWNKGERRPWNADLKTLCWKISQSFQKTKGNKSSFYGPLLDQYKAKLVERNEAGEFAEAAAASAKRVGKTTATYKHNIEGRLSPDHVNNRALRWVVKLFLSHWHHRAYEALTGNAPPQPYAISVLGHGDIIEPPPWPEGIKAA